jgi:hypothetical protein
MLILEMEENIGLHIVDKIIKRSLEMELEVHIMRKRRPFKIAVSGKGAERTKNMFGVRSVEENWDFFKEHRDDFEDASSYLRTA